MPVIPYSGATSLEGHYRAVREFLTIPLSLKPNELYVAVNRGHLHRYVEHGQNSGDTW